MYKNTLIKLRNERNLSCNYLADFLKIDRTTYTHYENEDDLMPLKHLNTIANFFDVSIDYLFGLVKVKQFKNSKKEIDPLIAGKRLKEFRKNNKLTLKQLAQILNCSYGTIAGYESGRYIIATPFLYDICKYFKISADYLLGKIDNPSI